MKAGMTILVLAGVALATPAGAQTLRMTQPPALAGATPQIIGGQPASPAAWPATLRFDSADGMCTSTVVGPRAVLTAAHCIEPNATGTIVILGQTRNVRCEHHPGYAQDYRLDVALCLADGAITLPNDAPFETVNVDPLQPRPGTNNVTLLGYGCRRVGGGGPSGSLYQGQSSVVTAADFGPYVETRGGAAVCFGDSGGGAYVASAPGARRLFGINSRGDISMRSLLTATAFPAVARFLSDWRTRNAAEICGLDALSNCR